jgi:hypothetical protein
MHFCEIRTKALPRTRVIVPAPEMSPVTTLLVLSKVHSMTQSAWKDCGQGSDCWSDESTHMRGPNIWIGNGVTTPLCQGYCLESPGCTAVLTITPTGGCFLNFLEKAQCVAACKHLTTSDSCGQPGQQCQTTATDPAQVAAYKCGSAGPYGDSGNCFTMSARPWPTFSTAAELSASPWGAYYKAIYGDLPNTYPIDVSDNWMLHNGRASAGTEPKTRWPWPWPWVCSTVVPPWLSFNLIVDLGSQGARRRKSDRPAVRHELPSRRGGSVHHQRHVPASAHQLDLARLPIRGATPKYAGGGAASSRPI